jgi:hypothetical protein
MRYDNIEDDHIRYSNAIWQYWRRPHTIKVKSPAKRQDDTELYSFSNRALDQSHAPAALSRVRGPVAFWQEASIAPGPVWMGMKKTEYIAPTAIRNKNCPGRSKSLYRLYDRRPIKFSLIFVHFFERRLCNERVFTHGAVRLTIILSIVSNFSFTKRCVFEHVCVCVCECVWVWESILIDSFQFCSKL